MRKGSILKSLNFFIKGGGVSLLAVLSILLCHAPQLMAAEEDVRTKKTTTQSVGGLLFDVDEGVKVEQGAGGSVYVKSNREYMQEKFAALDRKLQGLEERVTALESKHEKALAEGKSSKENSHQALVS